MGDDDAHIVLRVWVSMLEAGTTLKRGGVATLLSWKEDEGRWDREQRPEDRKGRTEDKILRFH